MLVIILRYIVGVVVLMSPDNTILQQITPLSSTDRGEFIALIGGSRVSSTVALGMIWRGVGRTEEDVRVIASAMVAAFNMRAQSVGIVELLKEFGGHKEGCPWSVMTTDKCLCGWSALLKVIETAKERM
jgi:cation transporter-like permease